MEITTELIKKLRDDTGVSVMQCKKALEEANGDIEKATIILLKKSGESAAKKEGRELGAGVVAAYIHNTGNVGVMVELMSETDFVANNEEFKKLAYDIAMHVAASNPEYLKKEDVTEEARAKVSEVLAKEVEDKKADMKEKILAGKLDAYFNERTLLEQAFVKNQRFVRYSVK
jgi:elongation factor Ts